MDIPDPGLSLRHVDANLPCNAAVAAPERLRLEPYVAPVRRNAHGKSAIGTIVHLR